MFDRVHYEPRNKGAQVNVHTHHHSHHGRYHRHYYNTSGWGFGSLLIGSMIVIPIILIALILKLTVSAFHFATTSMAATGLVGAKMGISAGISTSGVGLGMGSTLAFSTALGIGALFVYGSIGMLYLYFSAKECYSNNKNVFPMFKSQVVNEDGLSFTGAVKSIGAILWSPFLLIGGLAGMGAKAVVQTYHSRFSQSKEDNDIELEEIKTSYSQMKDLGLKNTQNTGLGQNPVQKTSLFYDPSTEERLDGVNPIPTHIQLRCN